MLPSIDPKAERAVYAIYDGDPECNSPEDAKQIPYHESVIEGIIEENADIIKFKWEEYFRNVMQK